MKPARLLLAISTLAFALLFAFAVTTANAAAAKKPAEPPVDKSKQIKSVDAAAGTVVIERMDTQTTHLYKVDDFTSIKVNNSPAKIGDIKVGMKVTDSVERDDQALDSISVETAGASRAATAPSRKK